MRLGDVLRLAASPSRFTRKTALIWGEDAYSYAACNALANRAAHVLLDLGVHPGDCVAVLGRNCPEYVWLYFALAKLGAIMVPVNFWYRASEVEYTLRQSGASFLVYDRRFEAVVAPAVAAYGAIQRSLTWEGSGGALAPGSAGSGSPASGHTAPAAPGSGRPAWVNPGLGRPAGLGLPDGDLSQLMDLAQESEPAVDVSPEDRHIILYTSGTTGFPKGAAFTQRAHYLHAVAWALMTGQHEHDVGLLVYPLFHTGGPDCILLPHFLVGGTVVLQDGADPAQMLAAVSRHRATNVFCVPTVWRRILATLESASPSTSRLHGTPGVLGASVVPSVSGVSGAAGQPGVSQLPGATGAADQLGASAAYDVSSVQRCLGSSDTLPPDLLDGLLSAFDADVYVTYGLTEAGCILTYSRLTAQRREKIGAVGRPHPLVEVQVHLPDGTPAPPGEVGEVVARGPTLMDAYWQLPEKTAEAFAGGWLHSGDLGRFDGDGYLHLAGRAKDMIITGGEKVYPVEVERLIKQFPGVADAALVGVPDPEWGESVLACIVRQDDAAGQAVDEASIQRHVRQHLAGYKRPRYVEFVDVLPTTSATSKVRKSQLRERFRDKYLAIAQERIARQGVRGPAHA